MRQAVQQAIMSMRARYRERITLQEIASAVFVAPFHFSRIFVQDTGVTPGQFLTSIRLFEAKRLLLTTTMTVSDIVCSVGYSSVGSFTKRFTRLVGLTPGQYRAPEVDALLVAVAPDFHQLPSPAELDRAAGSGAAACAAACGSIVAALQPVPAAGAATVVVASFGSRIPQSSPVAYAATSCSGPTEVTINHVPAGEWTVLAVAEPVAEPVAGQGAYLGTTREPVKVTAGQVSRVALKLAPVTAFDPPIAITLAAGGGGLTQRGAVLRAAA